MRVRSESPYDGRLLGGYIASAVILEGGESRVGMVHAQLVPHLVVGVGGGVAVGVGHFQQLPRLVIFGGGGDGSARVVADSPQRMLLAVRELPADTSHRVGGGSHQADRSASVVEAVF